MKNLSTQHPQKFSFEITSGKVHITDPCYVKDETSHCTLTLPAENGQWLAYGVYSNEGNWGWRVKQLIAQKNENTPNNEKLLGAICVDSGQAGIFDYEKYPVGEPGEFGDLDTFYGKACKLSSVDELEYKANKLNGMPYFTYGTLEFGVNSSSGDGDGSYNVYGRFNDKDELVYIRIEFYSDDVEEDWEDEADYEDKIENGWSEDSDEDYYLEDDEEDYSVERY